MFSLENIKNQSVKYEMF